LPVIMRDMIEPSAMRKFSIPYKVIEIHVRFYKI
jgi:hypothetical protein